MVDGVKRKKEDGWSNVLRRMSCIKMYGLDITIDDYLCVRDHRSRECPLMFWKHNLKKNSDETIEWKVSLREDGDVLGRVLRKPLPFIMMMMVWEDIRCKCV